MNEIEFLKELLTKHCQKFPGKMVPKFLQVFVLSRTTSPENIAFDLEINLENLKRKFVQNGLTQKGQNQFIEVPFSSDKSLKKQIVIELPHNIKVKIDL